MGSPWATAMNQKVGQRVVFERSKNVVQAAPNRDKLRKVGEQKGRKTACWVLLQVVTV